jgi:hypothetical protein
MKKPGQRHRRRRGLRPRRPPDLLRAGRLHATLPSAAVAGRSCGERLVEKQMLPDLVFAADRRGDEGPGRRDPGLRERETEFISLRSDDDYALYDGDICSDRHRPRAGPRVPPHEQRVRRAPQHQRSTARSTGRPTWWVRWPAGTTTTTGCAPRPWSVAAKLGLKPDCHEPVHEHRGPGRRVGPLLRSTPWPSWTSLLANGIRDEVPNQDPTQPRHGRRRHRGAARHPVPRVHLRPAGAASRSRQLHHPDGAEPGQHRRRHEVKLVPEVVADEVEGRDRAPGWRCWCGPTTPASACSVHMLDVKFTR